MTNSIAGWLRAKRIERAENTQLADKDPEFKAALIERARRDPVFFFNQFAWTYDPRPEAKPNNFPFLTFPFQDDYIRELESAFNGVYDLHTDKSRDMGASWMVLTWIVYKWRFGETFNALTGSRKEDYVDNYQPDSLFGKMDYQIRSLPDWLLPKGYNHQKHRTFCKIVNPESGNTIQGESANRDFSRAGRYSVILLDEFAFWEFGDSVWTATADSSPVRIVVSTPRGKNNKFGDLKFNSDIKKISLHWTLHPFKDEQWYANEKLRRTPREVAQELDIDYEASGSERVFNLKFNQTLRQNVVIEPFEIPEHWAFRGGLDYGTRNKSAFHVFVKDYDGTEICIFEWRRNMEDLKAEGFNGSMVQAIAQMLMQKCPYYNLLDHIRADPNLWVKNQNSPDGMTSIVRQIEDEIKLLKTEAHKKTVGFVEGAQSDIACIEVVNSFWADPENPQLKFFKSCPGIIEEYEELMWEDWSDSQQEKRNKKEKILDKNNHSWDASKYYLMSRHSKPKQHVKPPAKHTGGWWDKRLQDESKSKRIRTM
jgi:hypothetical protein